MAEQIQQPTTGQRKGVRRAKRLSTRIDLTPMVDLGFLLITFFILTTTWSQASHMRMHLPAGNDNTTIYGESTALTLIPLENGKIFYYHGNLGKAILNHTYGTIEIRGVRNLIIQKQLALDVNPKYTREDLALIVKPSTQSIYKDIVAVMDEVLINELQHYSFVDLSPEEFLFLQQEHVL
jgi:biopolymer transport protein ExbD